MIKQATSSWSIFIQHTELLRIILLQFMFKYMDNQGDFKQLQAIKNTVLCVVTQSSLSDTRRSSDERSGLHPLW